MTTHKMKPNGPLEVAVFLIACLMVIAIAVGVALNKIKVNDVPTLLAVPGGLITAFGIPKAISLGKFGHLSLVGLERDIPDIEAFVRNLRSGNIVGAIGTLESLIPEDEIAAPLPGDGPPEPVAMPPADKPTASTHDQTNPPKPTPEEVAAAQETIKRADQS